MRVVSPQNSLEARFPKIASELDSETIRACDLSYSSNTKVWWRCQAGHRWFVSVNSRTNNGSGCPYCSGRLATPDNNLSVCCPDLVVEWNWEVNGQLRPEHVKPGSNKKLWWKCRAGHQWEMAPNERTGQGQGCPYCSGRRVGQGNSLLDVAPEIAMMWHPSKNGGLHPSDVTKASHRKVWWMCDKGHEWSSPVSSVKSSRCSFCSGRRVCAGGSLAATHPLLAEQWSEKNTLGPGDVVPGSHRRVWWRCWRGHEWKIAVYARAQLGSGCPRCCSRRQVSKMEMRVYAEMKWLFPDAVSGASVRRVEVDVLIPSLHIAVEVDGSHWHSNRERDIAKNNKLEQAGLKVLRFRQHPLPLISDSDILAHDDDLLGAVTRLAVKIGEVAKVDVSPYCRTGGFQNQAMYERLVSGLAVADGKSLADKFPRIAAQWHPVRNGSLQPETTSYGSKDRVWWRCDKGHEWLVSVNSRTARVRGCPHCYQARRHQ